MNGIRFWIQSCAMMAATTGIFNTAQAQTHAPSDVPHITASFSILQSVCQDLLGMQGGKVVSLVGKNQDSHGHQLRAADVQTMQRSRLIVLNGIGFESAALQRAARGSGNTVVEAGAGLQHLLHGAHDHHEHEHEDDDHDHDHHHEHDHDDEHHHDEHKSESGLDPHVWLDPLNMPQYTANISRALMQAQREQALYYGIRWQLYQLKLAKLHGENVRQLAGIPLAKRKVLTSHAAFAYMGRRYQIEFVAPVGGGHEAEASAKTLVNVIRQVRREHIQAVFVENISNERLLRQLGRETGLRVQGTLYSDALADDAADYFQFYRHNIKALTTALR